MQAAKMEADIEEFVMLTKTRSHRKLKRMRRRMDHTKFNGTSTFDTKHCMNSGPEIDYPNHKLPDFLLHSFQSSNALMIEKKTS